MKLAWPAAVLLCLANPVHAQTRAQAPPVQVNASTEKPLPIAAPRTERPFLIEALILRDKRLALEIRKRRLAEEAHRK